MTLLSSIQIEAAPFLTLAITLFVSNRQFNSVRNIRRFQRMVIMVMLILAVDVFNWYAISEPFTFPAAVLRMSNTVYFLLSEVIAYQWFVYVVYQINDGYLTLRQKHRLTLCAIPLILVCGIIISTPWTGFIFTIDPVTQVYARGSLHIFQTVCGFFYMILASALAFEKSRKATLTEKKNESRFLCFIIILPLVGGTLQIINYNFVFLWSFTAAAAFLMFIDFQSHWISVDTLTSLNNRGNLEKYLQNRAKEHELYGYLFMIDVDRFKSINDRYGHLEGDRALKIVADTLKIVFGASGAFLSRYGGDEFVVVADVPEPETVIAQCELVLTEKKAELSLPYEIQLSIGYVDCAQYDGCAATMLINYADSMMYERKRERS